MAWGFRHLRRGHATQISRRMHALLRADIVLATDSMASCQMRLGAVGHVDTPLQCIIKAPTLCSLVSRVVK